MRSRDRSPFRIGMHAPRNAGKTCLFACLYGLRHLGAHAVAFADEATVEYLQRAWSYLRDGKVPPATALNRPTQIVWTLDGRSIQSFDYAGVLVEPSTDASTRELRADARTWLRSCDALLVLVDSAAPHIEQLDTVDLLLSELQKESAETRTPARPLALVLTKWDTQGPIPKRSDSEADHLQAYLVGNPVFHRIQERLRACGGQFAIFTVSAFGQPCPGPGLSPPLADLKPFNLLSPWRWAVDAAQQARDVERRRKRRLQWAAALTTSVVLCLAIGSAALLGRNRASDEYHRLEQFRASHSDAALASERRRNDDAYLRAWWSWTSLGRRETVSEWRASDDRAAREHREAEERVQRERRHASDYWRVLTEGSLLISQKYESSAFEMYRKFLETYPDSPHIKQVRSLQEDARRNWDERTWAELQEYHRQYGATGNIQNLLARIRTYLSIPQASHRREAEAMLEAAERDWDRDEYDRLRRESLNGLDGKTLEDTERLASAYVRASRRVKTMTGPVQQWLDWFGRFQVSRHYHIRVKSVSIPQKSELDSIWGVDPVVTLVLGDEERRTEVFAGRNATMNADLSPFSFRWGEPTRLIVRVENQFALRDNYKIEREFTDTGFVLGKAHGPIHLACKKGKTISVELECPGAVPPALPVYVEK